MILADDAAICMYARVQKPDRTASGGGKEVHSRAGRLARSLALAGTGLMITADPVPADELFDYGAYLPSECTPCHRLDGVADKAIPSIVGWPETVFIRAMDGYRRGELTNAIMQNVARSLGDEETAALARFFNQQGNRE
jgi:cytochrome c553